MIICSSYWMNFQSDFPAICFEADLKVQQQRESVSCWEDKSMLQRLLKVYSQLLFQQSWLYFCKILEGSINQMIISRMRRKWSDDWFCYGCKGVSEHISGIKALKIQIWLLLMAFSLNAVNTFDLNIPKHNISQLTGCNMKIFHFSHNTIDKMQHTIRDNVYFSSFELNSC